MHLIPQNFIQTTHELYGSVGTEWLSELPTLIADCAECWSLTVAPPFENLSYTYVAPALGSDNTPVVLKVGFPNPELLCEMDALRLYNGHGMVRLLEADPERGIMLLERLEPGMTLADLNDDTAATSIAAQVMHQLWRPVPASHSFPTVERWATGLQRLRAEFDGGCGPFPKVLVEEAESLFTDLRSSMDEPVLLHGDLHHYNILSAARQPWLAIDPKGVVGEPAYEIGAWLRNPLPLMTWPHPERVLARRIDQFADELGFDRERIWGWGLAQAVLSAWWYWEDHGYVGETALACAQLLATLKV
ncbi:MAG: phosphotransferase [Chloroflexi bacterium AL-W]|nr:phosphotransferase [Chloroflexi bacterium AL-N1]NOK67824.1 phosphotransferase [Chloroflexi bacterium AL-N10]NOK75406.1 phosphotransferase [Chloroflexi bacterium AL-N5]NOK82194.1 phosphotransferase [Chloroflexi bacterium AL-W]NOK90039.1 phosphotransferase [Chloroflexi bacterium AL-N15]